MSQRLGRGADEPIELQELGCANILARKGEQLPPQLRAVLGRLFDRLRGFALAVIDDMANDWAQGFVAEAFDPSLPPLERLDYMVDAAYYWQKAAKDIEGRVRGCLFGNLALEISTREEVLRAKLMAVFNATQQRFKDTLEEAVASGALAPLDTDKTAAAMLARAR